MKLYIKLYLRQDLSGAVVLAGVLALVLSFTL